MLAVTKISENRYKPHGGCSYTLSLFPPPLPFSPHHFSIDVFSTVGYCYTQEEAVFNSYVQLHILCAYFLLFCPPPLAPPLAPHIFIAGLLAMNIIMSSASYVANPLSRITMVDSPCVLVTMKRLFTTRVYLLPPPLPVPSLHRDSLPTGPPHPTPNVTSLPSLPNQSNPPGIPINSTVPILRHFQPFQASILSTAEENRQKSIARMNTVSSKTKKKGRLPPKALPEPVTPVVTRDASVLFFPVNVSHLSSLASCLITG